MEKASQSTEAIVAVTPSEASADFRDGDRLRDDVAEPYRSGDPSGVVVRGGSGGSELQPPAPEPTLRGGVDRPGMGEFANVPGGIHRTAPTEAQRRARLEQQSAVERSFSHAAVEPEVKEQLVPPAPAPEPEPEPAPAPVVPEGFEQMSIDEQMDVLLGSTDALLAAADGRPEQGGPEGGPDGAGRP